MTVKRQAGRPTRERAERLDDEVLDGARRAFCRHGLDGVSMDDIARETGVTKQAIYRRYDSKTALLYAVVARDLDRLRLLACAAIETGDALAMLCATARHLFDFGIQPDNARFLAFLMAEAAWSEPLRARFVAWNAEAREPTVALIRQAQAAGLLRAGDPAGVADLLFDLLDGAPRRLQLGIVDVFADRSADQYFEDRWAAFLAAAGRADG